MTRLGSRSTPVPDSTATIAVPVDLLTSFVARAEETGITWAELDVLRELLSSPFLTERVVQLGRHDDSDPTPREQAAIAFLATFPPARIQVIYEEALSRFAFDLEMLAFLLGIDISGIGRDLDDPDSP